MNENEWFEDWFDSPYYHILYRHRDTDEAEAFLSGLIKDIPMIPGGSVLDVACGRGRHAIYLNRRGFDVTGFDLSEQNTLHNLEFENDRLRFFRHDMRDVFCVNCFDYVVNLFSSFGYFERQSDNLRTLKAFSAALKPGGTLIFDYANSVRVRKDLSPASVEVIDGIEFRIRKTIKEPFVEKEIRLTENGTEHRYHEMLRLFEPEDLLEMISFSGLQIRSVYGDYHMSPFNRDTSSRLIVAAQKK